MNQNKYGQVILAEKEILDALYKGQSVSFDQINLDSDSLADQFNQSVQYNADSIPFIEKYKELDLDLDTFDKNNQKNWFMPDEYKNMDIEGFLVHVCPKENYQRLIEEIRLYKKHNLLNLLRYLKYLVDTMRTNNIVWGVGRGSSVASYSLYLLGIHKIDSVKYKLDIQEFFKEGD